MRAPIEVRFDFAEAPEPRLRFVAPRRSLTVRRRDELADALDALEAEARAGRWCALALAYEAAPAFDTALRARSSRGTPLLAAAVFDRPAPPESASGPPGSYRLGRWRPAVRRAEYRATVAAIRAAIARGETYQANYTFPLVAPFQGDLDAWYRDLRAAQGPGLAAWLDLGDTVVLSISPELFFRRDGDRVQARPMKGTAARGRWAEEDEAAGRRLADSAKDRAENVMIVDLVRNDLGRVAVPGTVRVPRLFEVERRPTLWQMTSTVEARLRPGVTLAELLGALFPCGSVTGAPKAQTMRLLRQIEREPRGFYCGAIGLLRPGGDAIFSVPIRTLTADRRAGTVRLPVGSGVTWCSGADDEYAECLLKARFARARPRRFDLLETLRLEDGRYAYLHGHLARMRASARYFGFPWRTGAALAALRERRALHPHEAWRVRLLAGRDGGFRTEAAPLPGSFGPRRLALDDRPVQSRDVLLYHKTTRRSLYDRALRRHPEADDVLLVNERGELTESCFANLVLTIDGRRLTPPLDAGLLPGIARRALLRQGEIEEADLTPADLARAEAIHLVNSVRGWMPAEGVGGNAERWAGV